MVVGTGAGVSSDRMIPLDELAVGIRDDRFYVRWQRENVEIIACTGHMLNNARAPVAMRFLDEISRDGRHNLSPSTGDRPQISRFYRGCWPGGSSCRSPDGASTPQRIRPNCRPGLPRLSGLHWQSGGGVGRCRGTCI